jgi:teichuronic acid biosynthesis glycosyltransferase TuaC
MDVVWLHTYNETLNGKGTFMFQQVDFFTNHGVNIELQYLKNIHRPVDFFKYLFRYRNKFKGRIVHAQYGSGTAFFTSLLKTKRKIVTLRGSDWYILPKPYSWEDRIRSRISRFLTIVSFSRFDQIIVMSESMKLDILKIRRRLKDKILVLPDGIDLSKFNPINKLEAKQKLAIKSSIFLVGVGSIDEKNSVKRIFLAKRAVELLKHKYPIELYVLTGIAPSLMNLHVNVCDVMVLTSVHEGWPNIIKEGLACNVPFVATNVSDLSLIASDINSNSYICTTNVSDIANKIERVYLDYRSGKIMQTRKFVVNFEMDYFVSKIIKIYLNLI